MPAMPRSKKAKEIANKILGTPTCLQEQDKPKKKKPIDVEYQVVR